MALIVPWICAFLSKWIHLGQIHQGAKLQSDRSSNAIVRKVSLTSCFLAFFFFDLARKNIFNKMSFRVQINLQKLQYGLD
jgi:hypothetical protein